MVINKNKILKGEFGIYPGREANYLRINTILSILINHDTFIFIL
jgi:hypothetical protein